MKIVKLMTALVVGLAAASLSAQEMPRIEKKDGRFALMVDGKPFLMLGAQINNSSSWAAELPSAWAAAEAMHVNTVEAPVYWEQMEPAKGTFDFANVDLLVNQARERHLHLVLLWFGTWKNGQNHYVPEWVKSDVKTYPREETAYGKLLDVMSPVSATNLEADKHAFAALMGHLKEIDGAQHTVLMIQVENESGSVGSVRDFSPAAQKLFEGNVPAELTSALHLSGGSWTKVFGPDADERFAAYSTAHYVGEVAKAGKAAYALPMYCNVWIIYPVHALENRDRAYPGEEYPSGGPEQPNVPIWKAAAPAIDVRRRIIIRAIRNSFGRRCRCITGRIIRCSFRRRMRTRTSGGFCFTRWEAERLGFRRSGLIAGHSRGRWPSSVQRKVVRVLLRRGTTMRCCGRRGWRLRS